MNQAKQQEAFKSQNQEEREQAIWMSKSNSEKIQRLIMQLENKTQSESVDLKRKKTFAFNEGEP
jgi:hypothetical protein